MSESLDRFVREKNIEKFRQLLQGAADEGERTKLLTLLAEEQQRLLTLLGKEQQSEKRARPE